MNVFLFCEISKTSVYLYGLPDIFLLPCVFWLLSLFLCRWLRVDKASKDKWSMHDQDPTADIAGKGREIEKKVSPA